MQRTSSYPYLLLVNQYGQHGIWPAFQTLPAGWQSVYGPANHESCRQEAMARWPDIRPRQTTATTA